MIAVSADGAYVFLALESATSGFPVIVKAARTDLSAWSLVYDPGAGSAANIAPAPGDPDLMFLFGNFGTNVTVLSYTISTDTAGDISPASLGAKVVNTLAVNPSDPDEIWITVDTDQDLLHTVDGGANWTALNGALALDATALAVLWSGAYRPDRGFIAGDNGADLDLLYTPNDGETVQDLAGATLGALTNICSLEVVEA